MNRAIILVTLIITICLSKLGIAGLYSGCIYGYNFSSGSVETFALYPINPECYTSCETQCKSLFSVLGTNGMELNQDVITRCRSYCQSSKKFSSYYRDASGNLNGPLTNNNSYISCSRDQVWNRVYKSNAQFSPGDNVLLQNSEGNSGAINKIYGCGYDNIEIKSIFKDDITSNWPSISPWPATSSSSISNDSAQALWTDSTQHYCLNSASNRPISGISKSKLLLGLDYAAINSNLLPSQPIPYMDSTSSSCTSSFCNILPDYRTDSDMLSWYKSSNGPCAFSSRADFTSTGLYVQDGDELSISWSGSHSIYPSNYNGSNAYGANNSALDKIVGLPLGKAIICSRDAAINKNYKVQPDGYAASFSTRSDVCQRLAYEKSKIGIGIGSGSRTIFIGEEARIDPIFTPPSGGTQRIINNFTGSVIDDPNVVFNNPNPIDCTTYQNSGTCPDSSANCSSCFYINGTKSSNDSAMVADTINPSLYTYSGTLSSNLVTNFTSMGFIPLYLPQGRDLLRIYMPDQSGYGDNVGGIDVSITWGGCPKFPDSTDNNNTPNAIEYVINSCSLDPDQMYDNRGYDSSSNVWVTYNWLPMPLNTRINVNNSNCPNGLCCVYFRIKDDYVTQGSNGNMGLTSLATTTNSSPLPLWGSNAAGLKNLYANPGNRHGYYSLSLQNAQASFTLPQADTTGPIHNIVSFVLGKVIGSYPSYNDGALKVFYTNVIKGRGYIGFIKTFLVLYITFFGLGFMIGAVQMSLNELLIRLIKVSFVVAMISDSSWNMFATYILPGIVNGVAELCATFVVNVANVSSMSSNFPDTDSLGIPIQSAISRDPSLIIALMVDQPLRYIWKGLGAILAKLVGIIFASPISGFCIAFILAVSLIVYSIGLLKIVMIYMLSFVAVGVLIFMAPLAIPMILFKFTQDVFDRWWKFLLSFAIQPILLFAGVSILNFLTIAVFFASFSYTVCKFCALYVPIINFCLIPGYILMDALHMPSNTNGFIPTTLVISSSLFLLLSYAIYEMPSVFTAMASRLITGVASDSNIGGAADKAYNSIGMAKGGQLVDTVKDGAQKLKDMASTATTVGRAYIQGVSDAGSMAKRAGASVGGLFSRSGANPSSNSSSTATDSAPVPTTPTNDGNIPVTTPNTQVTPTPVDKTTKAEHIQHDINPDNLGEASIKPTLESISEEGEEGEEGEGGDE